VEIATSRIESEQRKRDKWQKLSLSDLAKELFLLENRNDEWIFYHNKFLHSIESAVRAAKNFEDMKVALLDSLAEARVVDSLVRDVRDDIERQRNEFANDDGVVAAPSVP
jgi:hypothetical protein